ncbi:hypothetical protein [Jiella pacifica]|uniref:Uncharacterized protein n=1 Tax=Jiella pacifica TaxID=2696469 RepID=A0A6N9TC62_9HYPH|nr:hypothetical protein [Jiella pacifica]NDW07666.1 hypothetical protein [Jiella pacifica]
MRAGKGFASRALAPTGGSRRVTNKSTPTPKNEVDNAISFGSRKVEDHGFVCHMGHHKEPLRQKDRLLLSDCFGIELQLSGFAFAGLNGRDGSEGERRLFAWDA